MNKNQSKSDILCYWRAVEFFLPQKIPKVNPNDQNEPVFKIDENDLAPWSKRHKVFGRITSNKKLQIRHTIYGGVYFISKIHENMEATFGKDLNVFNERNSGETCLFSIQLTQDGRPLFDSFVLSMCSWALGRLKDPGPQNKIWLEGFEAKMDNLKIGFEQRFAVQEDDKKGLELKKKKINIGRHITISEILNHILEIQKKLTVEHLEINTRHFFVKSVIVHEKNALKVDDSDFLNSFFVKDLSRVSIATANNKLSVALSLYLAEDAHEKYRVDIRKLGQKEKLAHLSPGNYPRGCWPNKDFFPLVYAQQFSVNTIMETLNKKTGIFSVNGPPGTGKTTLLRDLITAIIVERAIKISELSDPSAAFQGEERWDSDSKKRSVVIWKEEFHGYEMIVASSNNSAVENVTLEIPAFEAIDASYLKGDLYLADIATEILDKDCWALLAAKLGNKNNRTSFKNKFWAYPKFMSKEEKEKMEEPEKPSFYKYLLNCKPSLKNWNAAVKKFKEVLEIEQTVRQDRQSLYEKYKASLENENGFFLLSANIEQIENHLAIHHEEIKVIEHSLEIQKKQQEEFTKRRLQHRQFKPKLMEIILSFYKAYSNWQDRDLKYQHQIFNSEKEIDIILHKITTCQNKINAIKQELCLLNEKKENILKNKAHIESGKKSLGKYFPDFLLLQDEINRELSSPWMDEIWFQARVNVFLEALNLQRAFIEINSRVFLRNLESMMDILLGKGQNAPLTKAIRSVWTTFFFVVPVISTTFASFDRLFPQFEHEELGWLFIDEAGQATPQAVVGALWRTKRAVVVGDPLQLEPILTLPITAQEALRKHFSVSEEWLPKRCSAQTLSDRANKYGTYLKNENAEDFWVGAPLRVHRRCENPMFDIANSIAYDGMMVFGTPLRSELLIENSCWFHIQGQSGDNHWIEAEGIIVRQLIKTFLLKGIRQQDIAIISPFTAVVNQLKYSFPREKFNLKVGTIHTMQGKEADVVILVLGGDPSKPGAKDWASEKPNLLNVAVSRAKKRLFVVGDRESWATRPYFRQLSQLLSNY